MKSGERIDDILSRIDAVVPPTEHPMIAEVHSLIQPQLAMIVALSGLEHTLEQRGKTNRDFIDTHHLFWPRVDYRSILHKTFRRQFIIPIHRGIHEEVHANLEPPKTPPRSLMVGYLALIDKKEHHK